MAMRSAALGGIPRLSQSAAIAGGAGWRSVRPFSEGKGRVLSEEEKAKENVYIQVQSLSLSLAISQSSLLFIPPSRPLDLDLFGFLCFSFGVENGEGKDG